ncbi:hypothetical protein CRUP_027545 [Coryphaenoides rupestris]|nr:hypothetical protein CRUP_027545 [Coryphaenoides rupestris]
MPQENLEEEGLPKNPDLRIAQLKFLLTMDGGQRRDVKTELMDAIKANNTYFGTMYTSDDRGILYTKSLERHLFGGHRKSDFTNITSLRGVYLTNKLEEDGRIRTVISFNRGGHWQLTGKPENVDCGDVQNCNLHIHGEHSRYSHIAQHEAQVQTIKYSVPSIPQKQQ